MSLFSLGVDYLRLGVSLIILTLLLGSSTLPPANRVEQVRAFTRQIEFDYIGWTVNALQVKLAQFSLGSDLYLTPDTRHQVVIEYLDLVTRLQQTENELNSIYADPNIANPEQASAGVRATLADLTERRDRLAPVAEAILQSQISGVISSMGLSLAGQPVPPVLYHSTPLPHALIVSPREAIRQDADISLISDLTVDQMAALEEQVDRSLNVSSLVVGIGGVGVYPTMVQQSSSLTWLSEVVAHEWIHNFLTLRPLGVNYLSSPELRIMNETAAAIAGKEIGRAVLERYYPELVPPPAPEAPAATPQPQEPPAFDFVKEMRETRVTVDALLAEGKVEEAEKYMEARRVIFWNNGYRSIRKLNQAYFAFHGAYADDPGGGAAGEDPVGAAVRALRANSPTLADFVKTISWMWSFEQLQAAVAEG